MSAHSSKLRDRREQRGAAAVEFGLIVGAILVPLLLGVIQYGWYFYVAQTTGGAATHLTRRLAVGDCWGSGQALTFAKNEVASNPSQTTLAMTPTTQRQCRDRYHAADGDGDRRTVTSSGFLPDARTVDGLADGQHDDRRHHLESAHADRAAQPSPDPRRRDDRGAVAVITAIICVLLFIIAASVSTSATPSPVVPTPRRRPDYGALAAARLQTETAKTGMTIPGGDGGRRPHRDERQPTAGRQRQLLDDPRPA